MRVVTTDLPVLLPPRAAPPSLRLRHLTPIVLSPWLISAVALALVASTLLAEAQAAAASRAGVFEIMLKWVPQVFNGFLFNLLVGVLAMAAGTASGVVLGLGLISLLSPVRGASWVLMQFFRNAPWLVLLFYAMFLLPFEFTIGPLQISIPAWVKAVIGLGLPVMANVAEIVRGGVQSIPLTQWESAESLAFPRWQTLWLIILPQAFKQMIPPWMNLYAILTMATTLISVVGIQDGMTMIRGALVAEARTDLYLPMYLMLLLMFFLYCYPIALWTAALERRFNVKG